MRAFLASLLVAAVQTVVSSPVHASPITFAIDLSFPFEPFPAEGGLTGTFLNAGTFRVESSLLPAQGSALISFAQVSDFSLQLPDFTIGSGDLGAGTCGSAARLPVCGFLFTDGRLRGLVGQYSMPTSDARFAFHLDNTSVTLFDTSSIFQSVSIDNLQAGITVASGFAAVRQPMPEPVSSLLFGAGAVMAALAARRRAHLPARSTRA